MKKEVWVVKTVLDNLFIHLILPSSGAMFDYEFQQIFHIAYLIIVQVSEANEEQLRLFGSSEDNNCVLTLYYQLFLSKHKFFK